MKTEQTLDEYLAEVDRWKNAVSDRLRSLPAKERLAKYREVRVWLEARIGHKLRTRPAKGREKRVLV
jgi:hypothetical protein